MEFTAGVPSPGIQVAGIILTPAQLKAAAQDFTLIPGIPGKKAIILHTEMRLNNATVAWTAASGLTLLVRNRHNDIVWAGYPSIFDSLVGSQIWESAEIAPFAGLSGPMIAGNVEGDDVVIHSSGNGDAGADGSVTIRVFYKVMDGGPGVSGGGGILL